jgi:hypothetical protein
MEDAESIFKFVHIVIHSLSNYVITKIAFRYFENGSRA